MNALDRSKTPTPKFRAWAAKSGTPWEAVFPRRGPTKAKRRFFATQEEAQKEITAWLKGGTAQSLSKKLVDEVHYLKGILPPGTTLTDTVRFFLAHNSGLTATTVKAVADAYKLDLKRSASAKYAEEQERMIDHTVAGLGPETIFSSLSRAKLIAFIKEPDSYWNRYGRKRAVSCLISKARELEAIRLNPLEGWKFEDAPKATPHILTIEATQRILEHTLAGRPELVASFALQLFAGVRTEELCREEKDGRRPLKWEDVTFGSKIEVPVEVSKTEDRRVITFWPEALTHWLNAVQCDRKGVICPVAELDDAKSKLLDGLAGVDFKQNDFRRTYASNAYALHGILVQDWMGHTDGRMLKKHYRDFVEKENAQKYFASKPQHVPNNLVALTA